MGSKDKKLQLANRAMSPDELRKKRASQLSRSSHSSHSQVSKHQGLKRSTKPVDMNMFMHNWNEKSDIDSPGANDSPKNKFYIDAAKYTHHKREKPKMANQIVLSVEASTDPGAFSDFGKKALSASHEAKGITVKEFKVDIRRPFPQPPITASSAALL